jgi:hypothetical protein
MTDGVAAIFSFSLTRDYIGGIRRVEACEGPGFTHSSSLRQAVHAGARAESDFERVLATYNPTDAPIAQLDRVLVSEAKGHRFDSCWARQRTQEANLSWESSTTRVSAWTPAGRPRVMARGEDESAANAEHSCWARQRTQEANLSWESSTTRVSAWTPAGRPRVMARGEDESAANAEHSCWARQRTQEANLSWESSTTRV